MEGVGEAGEAEEVEEEEDLGEAEENMKGYEDEKAWVDHWKPLVYNRGGVSLEDGGESERVIEIMDSSFLDEAKFKGHEKVLEDLDMSKEVNCHSGPFERECRDFIRGAYILEDVFGSDLGEEYFQDKM